MTVSRINGQPGVIFRGPHGGVFSVMSFEVVGGRVATVRSIVNPDKLQHFGAVESLRAVLDESRDPRGTRVAGIGRSSSQPDPDD